MRERVLALLLAVLMAFPSVRSDVANTQNTNSTSWTVSYPATISAGDLLLFVVSHDGGGGTASMGDGGFSQLYSQANGTDVRGQVWVKVASGSESGTTTYAPGASEQGAWRMAAYQDWYGTISGGVEAGGTATGLSNAANATSFSPSWGSAETRWRAQCAYDDGRTDVTSFPSGYTINQNSDASGGSGGASIGGASINSTASSQDPSAFGADRSDDWVAWVIAIRPNPHQTLTATAPVSTVTTPAATLTAATTLAATAPAITVTAPAASIGGPQTLVATAPVVTLSTPTATLVAAATLVATAPVTTVTTPGATVSAATSVAATAPVTTTSAPVATVVSGTTLSVTAPVVTATAPTPTVSTAVTVSATAPVLTVTAPTATLVTAQTEQLMGADLDTAWAQWLATVDCSVYGMNPEIRRRLTTYYGVPDDTDLTTIIRRFHGDRTA